MLKSPNQHEAKMKAAVIDRLIAGEYVDSEAVLISEMTVANWTRRADIVLANGALWGFELKSDADNLSRLPGQLETFQGHFEKFTVVAAQRFEGAILPMLRPGTGLWLVAPDGLIKQKVAPKKSTLTKDAYISLMTARELRALLSSSGIPTPANIFRRDLVNRCYKLSLDLVASAARDSLKQRYRVRHQEFMNFKNTIGTLGAIKSLSRNQGHSKGKAIPASLHTPSIEEIDIPVDHPQLLYTENGPVLKRKIT